MKKLHLTRYAAMASIALMGTSAAWGVEGNGWETAVGNTELQLFSGTAQTTVSIEDDDISSNLSKIKNIVVWRDAGAATYSTLMLPADVNVSDAYIYEEESGKVEAAYYPTTYNTVEEQMDFQQVETIKANKPYLVEISGSTRKFAFKKESGNYAIKPTGSSEHSFKLENTCWEFTGVYAQKSWSSANNLYGYDATDGVFVKALSATIYPMRAYLTCSQAQFVNGLGKVAASEPLPDVINVRFLDKDGGTLSIGKMNTRTGDIQMQDHYYDLKGRKLNGKPQNKIMYVNKKVIKH